MLSTCLGGVNATYNCLNNVMHWRKPSKGEQAQSLVSLGSGGPYLSVLSRSECNVNAMGLKPVTAPMPDRKELVENPKPVTKKEHAWVRATVGSLGYSWVTTRHAHDMKSRMRLAAVLNS